MNIFELAGKLTIQGAEKAEKQLGGLQNKVQGMAKGLRVAGAAMTAAGAIITGMATKAVIDYARMGDEVHKMSLRTGFATETLSKLKYASELGGAGLATVEKAAKRMAATIYDAEEGLSTAVDAMDNLGLSVEDFEGLSPEEQFMKLAEAIASIEDPSKRSALAQRIFGRAGTEMLPMLEKGTEGLREMMAEAEKFSPIFGKEAAEAAANLTDWMGRLKGTMDKVKLAIAENLVPIITPLIEKLTATIGKISTWAENNSELARIITVVTLAVGGLLLVLGPLVIILPQLVGGVIMLKGAMMGLYAAMGPVGWAIAGISGALTIAIPLIIRARSKTEDLTGAMSELEAETFKLNVQQKFTAEKWEELAEKGYLTEQEFKQLAEAMDLTTIALYDQLEAAGMLQAVWKAEDDRNIYLRNLEDIKIGLEDIARASELTTDEMIRDIEDLTYKAQDATRERYRIESDALDDRMFAAQKAHQETMSRLNDEYNATMKIIDAQLSATIAGYQSQIDAIDRQTRAIEDAQRMRQDAERKADLEAEIAAEGDARRRIDLEERLNELILRSGNEEWQGERKLALQSRIAEEKDAEARQELEEGLAEFLVEVQAQRNKEQLADEKSALLKRIDMAREQARNAKDQAQERYDHERRLQEQEFEDLCEHLEDERKLLDNALEEQLKRYDDDLEAFQGLLEQELVDLGAFVDNYNTLMDQLKDKTVTITRIQQTVAEAAAAAGAGYGGYASPAAYAAATYGWAYGYGFQHGGLIREPTLLTRLSDMRPFGIMAERRPEFITPGLPGITINIIEPHVRDDRDIDLMAERLVGRIRQRTGIRI